MIFNHSTEEISRTERHNFLIVMITAVLNTVITLFSTGTLLRNILLNESIGLSKANTSLLTVTLPQFAQMTAIGLTFFFADRLTGIIRKSALCYATVILQFAAILFVWQTGTTDFTFVILFSAILIYNVFYGVYTVWSFKMPYLIYQIEHFGKILSISGLAGNIISTGLSVLVPIWVTLNYEAVMRSFFIGSIILTVLYVILTFRLKPLPGAEEGDNHPQRARIGELFREPTGRTLLLSNFFRGLSMGVFQCITIIAAKLFEVTSSELSVMVTVTTIGAIVGNLIFSFISKPKYLAKEFTVISILYTLLFPLLFFMKNWYLFLAAFFFLQITYTLISVLVPTSVCLLIPYRTSGGYTSLRLMLTTGGTAIGGIVTGLILDHSNHTVTTLLLLVAAGLLQLLSGWIYATFLHRSKDSIS